MEALTTRLSFRGLLLAEFSLLLSIELLNIPSPTTALPFRLPQFDTLPSSFTVQAVPPTVRMAADRPIGHLWADAWDQGFTHCQESPRQVWPNRVHLRYGLFIRLWLLSTFSVENAVTMGSGAVTDSPIGTFTRQIQSPSQAHRRQRPVAKLRRRNFRRCKRDGVSSR